jgi:magnesium-transporting ATPase (P-type)
MPNALDSLTHADWVKLQQNTPWHTLPSEQVLERLATSEQGLPPHEAQARLKHVGKNELPGQDKPSLWRVFFSQFRSPLIYILIVAGLVALVIGDYIDATFIFSIIVLNAILGTYQEYHAEQSALALQRLISMKATVSRPEQTHTEDAAILVPGDVILLESGQRVPADIRLLKCQNLTIDEAILTGESQAVEKKPATLPDQSLPVGDRLNMAFSGSTVHVGRGTGVVVATGLQSEVGSIAKSAAAGAATKTPLVSRMEAFARKVSLVFVLAAVALAVISILRGYPLEQVILMAIALAVAAIPEGLPVALTVALSIGAQRMARRNVIVRKLMAVEGLGSCTTIVSDKTGTLTVNKQTVKQIATGQGQRFQVTGEGYHPTGEVLETTGNPLSEPHRHLIQRLAMIGAICNDARILTPDDANEDVQFEGDPLDVSLLILNRKLGTERPIVTIVDEIPYESERQFAAKMFQEDHRQRIAIKGASEKLLPYCTQLLTESGVVDLNTQQAETVATQLAQDGYRVILLAEGWVEQPVTEDHLPPLTLLGFVGMIDPLRPEALAAVQATQAAGVRVIIVTGDHPATAQAIARQLGMRGDVMTGQQVAHMANDPAFAEKVSGVSVFARVSPVQKLTIVEALKTQGHFVAVTGDGVNDTPALRAANIGVAMGSGSDIAKDTAMIIVTDDNFASIEAGVEEGRYAYENVRKVIYLLMSTGIGSVILVMLSVLAGLPLPLFAAQLLWLNIVTNGIQDIALAFEKGEPNVMKRPPRDPASGIIDRMMVQEILVASSTIGLLGFGTWWWLLGHDPNEYTARNHLFLLMVLLGNLHVFNARSEYGSAFSVPLRNNWVLVGGVIISQGVHIASLYLPVMQPILKVQPVGLIDWLELLALSSVLLLVVEVFKWFKRRKGTVYGGVVIDTQFETGPHAKPTPKTH